MKRYVRDKKFVLLSVAMVIVILVQQTVYAPDQETAQAFSAQAMELLWGLEQKEISWRL